MKKEDSIAFAVLILLVILLPLLSGSTYTLTVGVFSGINALVAIGLCILMGYAGQVSLGQAGFYGIGAYVSSVLSIHAGIPAFGSAILSMLVDIRRGKPSTIHRFVHLDPDRKPYFDIDGHAIETLNYVRENDPNGPLADDTLMMAATYHFSMGNYREADQLSDQLIHSYPHSEHQAEAHLINAESKVQSYKGASDDGRKLEEARRTLRSAMNQFPDELQPDRQRVIRELEEIRQEQAKSQFEVGEWYQRMAKRSPGDSDKFNRAARVYYQVVLNNFPGTKWCHLSEPEVDRLERHGQDAAPVAHAGPIAAAAPDPVPPRAGGKAEVAHQLPGGPRREVPHRVDDRARPLPRLEGRAHLVRRPGSSRS